MYYPLKIKPSKDDDIAVALDLVIDLAEQGVTDRLDNPVRYRKEMAAIELVRETFAKGGRAR
jgi:hypothetical protein